MPYAETSRVRKERLKQCLTIRELARLTGLSEAVIGKVERERNRGNIALLKSQGKRVPLTTVEVVMRIAAALGLMDYNTNYTLDEVAAMQNLIFKKYISTRPSRCKKPYPSEEEDERTLSYEGYPRLVRAVA